ncbi:hypothetical protein BaRGS_00038893, partial [Batillaria attramentaria]
NNGLETMLGSSQQLVAQFTDEVTVATNGPGDGTTDPPYGPLWVLVKNFSPYEPRGMLLCKRDSHC